MTNKGGRRRGAVPRAVHGAAKRAAERGGESADEGGSHVLPDATIFRSLSHVHTTTRLTGEKAQYQN